MLAQYILVNGRPVIEPNIEKWAIWMETADRGVALTSVGSDCSVSTVFLSLDHQVSWNGPPLLYETIIFGGLLDGQMLRYSTLDEAQQGHAAMVKRAQQVEQNVI